MLFQLRFFHDDVVDVTHFRIARFDDDHCGCSRLCRSRVDCLERCFVTAIQVFGLVTVELIRHLLPKLRFLQQAAQKQNRHLAGSLQSRLFSRSSERITKLDQAEVPTRSRSEVDSLPSNPHRHSGAVAKPKILLQWMDSCQQGQGTMCGRRFSHSVWTKNATVTEAEK